MLGKREIMIIKKLISVKTAKVLFKNINFFYYFNNLTLFLYNFTKKFIRPVKKTLLVCILKY